MSCNVAFIGLGVMGYPMAGYISKGGHNVTVFNRTKSKAEKWIGEYKGKMANTPAEAADGADFIFTCVGNDDDLREVATGENGLFNTAKAGSIFIDLNIPFSPKVTSFKSSSFPTHVNTKSESLAASSGVSAILPLYCFIHFSALDLVLL